MDYLNAVQIRQAQIKQNDIRVVGRSLHNRGLTGGRDVESVIMCFERCGNQVSHSGVVFHN